MIMENSKKYSKLSKIVDGVYTGAGVIGTGIGVSNGMPLLTIGSGIVAVNSAHNLIKRKFKNLKLMKTDYLMNGVGFGLMAIAPTYYCYITQTITDPISRVISGGLVLLAGAHITYPYETTLENPKDSLERRI